MVQAEAPGPRLGAFRQRPAILAVQWLPAGGRCAGSAIGAITNAAERDDDEQRFRKRLGKLVRPSLEHGSEKDANDYEKKGK